MRSAHACAEKGGIKDQLWNLNDCTHFFFFFISAAPIQTLLSIVSPKQERLFTYNSTSVASQDRYLAATFMASAGGKVETPDGP